MNPIWKFRLQSRGAAALIFSAFAAGALGCASLQQWWNPTSGYEAVGNPQLAFDEARAICESESEFSDFNGTKQVDWNKFERCMKPKGWVRPAS